MAERVLIVDDDQWILRMVSTLLEKRGYVPSTASNGEEGLRKASELNPHLIITDILMPIMDGWALIAAIRSHAALGSTPLLVLTALGGEEDRIRGFRLGVDDYLPKPFRFEELDLRVANVLRKQVQAKAELAKAEVALEAAPAAIQGTLEQLGLSSLLVMLELERKSGILRLQSSKGDGQIVARDGRVMTAQIDERSPPLHGVEAIYEMLTWTVGKFDFYSAEIDAADEVQTSTTHLLMEGARRADEDDRG